MSFVLKSNYSGDIHNSQLFHENILTKKIILPIKNININIKRILEKYLNKNYTGKCYEEGYIEKDSIKVLSYTNGLCNSDKLEFNVVFTCNICMIVDSMVLECEVENKNLSGIKCNVIFKDEGLELNDEGEEVETKSEKKNSVIVFCSRDHHYGDEKFYNLELKDKILVKVIGSKYELFDEYICVIGTFIKKT